MIQLDKQEELTLADLCLDERDQFCSRLDDEQWFSLPQHAVKFLNSACMLEMARRGPAQPSTDDFKDFLSHSSFRTLSREAVLQSLEQLVDYFERRNEKANKYAEEGPRCYVEYDKFYRELRFVYVYWMSWREFSCYDGGSGGKDYERVEKNVIFKYRGQTGWEQKKTDWKIGLKHRRIEKKLDEFTEQIKQIFGYHGRIKNANFPVLPDPRARMMLMKDPFGLPGVYEIRI